jgi:predicted NAD/FAD-dependent oxidoreductase
MTVARELATHGFEVVLFEKTDLVGGKAGSQVGDPQSKPIPGVRYEHGYHIFAPWYGNMLGITKQLGIQLIGVNRWHYRTMGQGWKGLFLPSTPRELLEVLRNSPLPAADTLLYFYFVLDMIGQPLSQKAVLDRITRLGLMRDRWYVTDTLPEIEQESILKAAAVPLHEMSAYTAKILSSYFLWTLKPTDLMRMFRPASEPPPSLFMLPGDLQETLIEPYRKLVEAAGVTIRCGHEATKILLGPVSTAVGPNGTSKVSIAAVEVVKGNGTSATTTAERIEGDVFVVATPLDVTQRLLAKSEILALEPSIGEINHLRTAPMASLHLTLAQPVAGLPKEHCFLMGGVYGLSFIDLSSHWREPKYTLSFISSNFAPLRYLSRQEQYDRLIAEIGLFLPIRPQDVTHWCLFPNDGPGKQLFINTVGSWTDRPDVKATNVSNLYFAGDWVKNRVDLACMEGAVSAALNAARAVAEAHQHVNGVTIPDGALVAGRYSPTFIRWVVRLAAPLALLAFWWAGGSLVRRWRSK